MKQGSTKLKVIRVSVADLKSDPRNARVHTPKNLDSIRASLVRFGQQRPILIDGENVVRAGNGTLAVAIELGWTEIDAIKTNLVGEEAAAYAIADNRTAELAEWDQEVLLQHLNEFQATDEQLLLAAGFTVRDLEKYNAEAAEGYTTKMQLPIYEPTGECPSVTALVDRAKVQQLIDGIMAADVSDEVRQFLLWAAERHSVFDFTAIAEFYAHAASDVQQLFEQSALVIVDFDKALESGLIRMQTTIDDLILEEQQRQADEGKKGISNDA